MVGGGDIGDKAGFEPLAQALFDGIERSREPVAREHKLPAALVQRVERVEELLLGPRLARQELDVVDQEHINASVGLLEGIEGPGSERLDEVVGERLDRRVTDVRGSAERLHVVADRVEEVSLPQAGWRVEEERV